MPLIPLIEKKISQFQRHLLFGLSFYHQDDFEHALEDFRKATEAFMKTCIISKWGDSLGYDIVMGKSDINGNELTATYPLQFTQLLYIVQQERLVSREINTALTELQRCHAAAHNPNIEVDFQSDAQICKPEIRKVSAVLYNSFSLKEPQELSEAFEGRLDLDSIQKMLHSPWVELYNATDRFSRANRYLLVSPPKLEDCTPDQMQMLSLVKWSFVVDFDPDSREKGIHQAFEKGGVNNIMNLTLEQRGKKNLLTNGSAGSVNWLFANGIASLPDTITAGFPAWRSKRYHLFLNEQLSDFFAKETHHYVIIYLWDDWDFLEEIIRTISNIEVLSQDLCKHIILTQDPGMSQRIPELKKWSSNVDVIGLSASELASNLDATIEGNDTNSNSFIVPGRNLTEDNAAVDVADIYHKLLDGHIQVVYKSIFLEKRPADEIVIPTFLNGEEISWHDLNVSNEVERFRYEDFRKTIYELLVKSKKSLKFDLLHKPGAGGTVLSRRLAFDMRESFPTILIERYTSNTFELLSQFLDKVNKTVLALVESSGVEQDDLENLMKICNSRKLTVCFVYIRRTMGKAGPAHSLSVVLDDSMADRAEKDRFMNLVKRHSATSEAIGELQDRQPSGCEVIDFSLSISQKNYSNTKLNDYVGAYLDRMPENQVLFTVFVAIVYHYSQKSVSHIMFRSMFKNGLPEVLRHVKQDEQFIRKLLLQEYDVRTQDYCEYWRPRFSKFSDAVLSIVLGGGKGENWKDNISSYALRLIREFKENNEYLVDETREILKSVFFNRESEESQVESQIRGGSHGESFSLLIRDIADKERQLEVLNALIDAYPGENHFKGQLARFIYEKALERKDFNEAEALIEDALSSGDGDADFNLHHFGGMCKRREIDFLFRSFKKSGESEISEYQLKDMADTARAYFDASIERNPYNLYAYVAVIQMLLDVIDYGRELSGTDNRWNFLNAEKNVWYLDKYYFIHEQLEITKVLIENQQTLGVTNKLNTSSYFLREGEGKALGLIGDFDGSTGIYQSLIDSVERTFRPKMRVMVIQSMLLSKVRGQRKDLKTAWRKLKDEEVSRIRQLLNDNILQDPGNMVSFRLWFNFIRNTNVLIDVDEITSTLKKWYENAERSRILQLEASFYLYVLSAYKLIDAGDSFSITERTNCEFFLNRCRSLSLNKKFNFEYLSIDSGIDAIVNHRDVSGLGDDDYRRVEGTIIDIEERQTGTIMLKCGLKAFFNPSAGMFLKGTHEGTDVSFYVAFRHEGLAAVDVKRVNSIQKVIEIAPAEPEELDIIEPIEELEESNLLQEEPEINKNFIQTRKYVVPSPKVLDKINLDKINDPKKNRKRW